MANRAESSADGREPKIVDAVPQVQQHTPRSLGAWGLALIATLALIVTGRVSVMDAALASSQSSSSLFNATSAASATGSSLKVGQLRGDENADQREASAIMESQHTTRPYAYMFYITSDNYACAALQLMHRLVHKVHMDTTTIDLVVLHTPRVGTRLLDKMQQQLNARTVQVDELRAVSSDPTWLTSLTKLRAFQDWGYERVVFLDADAFPMANLDHLFKLPSAPLIAPTAYWIQQPFFASTLMVIEPSNTTFDSILQWAEARGAAAGFDMDILNAFFRDSVQYLPGEYNVLNSDFRSAPESENKLFPTTSELKSHTKVVHFSCKPDGAYGKPWGWPSHDLSLLDGKGFDPLFRELFEDYWRGEKELCEQ